MGAKNKTNKNIYITMQFLRLTARRSVLGRTTYAQRQNRSISTSFYLYGRKSDELRDLDNECETFHNLKAAFAGESQANRRYLYFAQKADIEGLPDVAAVFRSTAEGETGHAFGHLEFLEAVGDPATDMVIGNSEDNLRSAIEGETHEYTDMYPGMARTAREEGFDDIADWFETLALAEKSHAGRFQKALDSLGEDDEDMDSGSSSDE